MSKAIRIKKGLDIPLEGEVNNKAIVERNAPLVAVQPDDFPGYTWKCAVKPGESVLRGAPLMYAKEDERIVLVSPVCGIVQEIKRGERRHIEYISVKHGDSDAQYQPKASDDSNSVIDKLMQSGLFTFMRQRPFDIVPSCSEKSRDIFITAFDSSPLAADLMTDVDADSLEEGIKVLSGLTSGKVYLSVRPGNGLRSNIAEVIEVDGPHPAGNVGVQIANTNPVNKGEIVWTLDAVTAARIGKFFKTGVLDFSTVVGITGEGAVEPKLVKTTIGVALSSLLKGEVKGDSTRWRIISGNVLTGYKENQESGFLHFPYRQITIIAEGNDADEFMGWASVSPKKYSVSHAFPAFLRGLNKPFKFDARLKGGRRAMIMSGEYDKVFPMDIYPEYLIKAIMNKDIERMEQLGIYEVVPEDFALAEFVDTSKIEIQKLVREGLDYLRKETM